MNKFHQIPTDTFVPISHDNSYLFNHYDKVANFLAFNLEKNYKTILAKPVQNNYAFDWFSVFENLTNISEKSKNESEIALVKYWEFIAIINAKISQLSASKDENNKNWANLLTKVFNHNDNFIFSNGTDICIVWGWKFDNNQNYKPNFSTKPLDIICPQPNENLPVTEPVNIPIIPAEEKIKENDSLEEEEIITEVPTPETVEDDLVEDDLVEESSFLKFLKWFASNFCWLLLVLTALIILVFLYKSIIYKAI